MKSLMKWMNIIIAALGVVSLIMIFLPAVKSAGGSVNGLQVAFGDKDELLKFSFLNCITWVAVIGVIVTGLLAHKSNNKTMTIVAVACAVVAALCFFLTKTFMQFDIPGAPSSYIKEIKKLMDLGIGSILGGICSLLAAAAGVCKIVLDK